jgi:protocatechuate 3,4-dioxygenase beta subunit
VHFSILGSGIRLVTQMYFPDEPLNEKDFIFLIVPEDHRARVIGRRAPSDLIRIRSGSDRDQISSGAEARFEFDVVIRGRWQTPPDLD